MPKIPLSRSSRPLPFLLSLASLVALTVLTVACSRAPEGSDRFGSGAGGGQIAAGGLDLEVAMQMLQGSWMQQSAADPSKVTDLIDAPGGEGWLRLFHGDLKGAERLFLSAKPLDQPQDKGSARAGLARVHLDRARTLLRASSLQREVAAALVRYRQDHRGEVRQGPYDEVLADLVLQAAGDAASDAAGDAAQEVSPSPGSAPHLEALRALLLARRSGSASPSAAAGDGLPKRYRDRLLFVAAMGRGDLGRAEALTSAVHSGAEDILDPLGADSQLGVSFKALYFDAAVPHALARYHLAHAWLLGAGLDGPGEAIAFAVQQSWGAPLPETVRASALPAAGPQPAWLALFLGPAIDRDDWAHYWAGTEGARPFLAMLQDQMPAVPWLHGSTSADVDAIFRATTRIEPTLRDALIQSVGSEGASLSQDLGFAATTLDRLLRTRILDLVNSGAAIQAKRLAERSLDAEPTRLGGAPSSAATRVSYRNDRAFLIDLARCLWKIGQVDASLSYIHPLAEEHPELRGLAYYLGQLDATRSIRIQGKTAQQ